MSRAETVTEPRLASRILRHLWRLTVRLVAGVLLVVATVLVVPAFTARKMPDLESWHRVAPDGEFHAADAPANFGIEEYRRLEETLFAGLARYETAAGDERSALLRYAPGGARNPTGRVPNWNRTFEMVPEQIRGGVLMLHGLTDSPYSLRSIAEVYRDQGFYVLCPRMPGHGTVPAALTVASWRDWVAVVEFSARHVRDRVGPERPLHVVGYSTGGALGLLHVLRTMDDASARPDQIVLFSPAVGITPLARVSNSHAVVSWIPYFEKYRWLGIEPEIDSFKYASFPKNAGAQSWAVTAALARELDLAAADGRLERLPPVLAFQSLIDTTVVADHLLTRLFDRLGDNGSELVVFDVNNFAQFGGLFRVDYRPVVAHLESDTAQPYRLTFVTNEAPDSAAAVARTKPPRSRDVEVVPTGLSWPTEVYSLSHLALPFPPDDPEYGAGAPGVHTLGNLAPRGERNVLSIPAENLLRLRYNPFHAYVKKRIIGTIIWRHVEERQQSQRPRAGVEGSGRDE